MLATDANAQRSKSPTPVGPALHAAMQLAQPQVRSALMEARGIERIPFHGEGTDARGGVMNDDCATAEAITLIAPGDCATGAISGNNGFASNGAEQPGCDDPSDAGYQDVWYTFNAGANTLANITLTPADPTTQDWGLVVYDACGGNEVACEIIPEGPVSVTLTPGSNYYVRVYSNLDWGVGGPFTLCTSFATPVDTPANDECTGAVNQDLAVGSSVTFTGDNTGATDNGEGLDTPAVWEMFTTTECANITLGYCGTAPAFGNGFLNLFIGCPQTDFVSPVTFDDTTCGDGNFTIFYSEVPAGTYYYAVMLDEANDAVGPYTITVSASACAAAPANDECAGAIDLTPGASCTPVAGTTAGATESLPAIACNGFTSPTARDVWYSFMATSTDHTVTVEGLEDFDGVLELFSGDCDDLASIVCEDSNYPTLDPATEVMVLSGLTVGQTYYLRIYDYGHGSTTGHNFNVCVTVGAPPAVYCTPAPTNGPSDGDYISNVTLEDINNTTAGGAAYEDYTSMTTNLEQGQTYTISIAAGEYDDDVIAAWIDFNQDTVYQATEKLGEAEISSPFEVVPFTFTVPADAALGTTRLHVRCAYGATEMDPCTPYSYGETEDYSVEIVLHTGVQERNEAQFQVYPNPAKEALTVVGPGLHGQVDIDLLDMTGRVVARYQQQMSAGQPATLPLSANLAQGTYTLRIITANGTFSRPVMVK